MLLRPYQKRAVERSVAALNEQGNTLLVSPTGSGKTIILSKVNQEMMTAYDVERSLILQHRDELTSQNLNKFRKVTDNKISVSLFDAKSKSFRGRATFAMVQTLARNLGRMPKDLSLITIDEGHHCAARSYLNIIDQAKQNNPNVKIFLTTATPVRGDKKSLRGIVNNVSHEIKIGDLIARGNLVRPITYKPAIGDIRESVNNVKKTAVDFDMAAVADVMDHDIVTDEIIRHWKEKAGDRKTIVFCANTDHAEHVAAAFNEAGVRAGFIHSNMDGSRESMLKAFERNEIQVLVNVMILTEGFDDQTVSCVVILRPSAYRSTFVQIVGRGLRSVDPALHPGFFKKDCIVLDFCTDHDSLEQDIKLALKEESDDDEEKTEAPSKTCPECESQLPAAVRECPICGYEFPRQANGESVYIDHVELSEIDLLAKSNFKYVDLFDNDRTLFSSGFEAWSGVFNPADDEWYAVGGTRGKGTARILGVGDRSVCVSKAEDWISENETESSAYKNKSWLRKPATSEQVSMLSRYPFNRWERPDGFNRYGACCRISYVCNENDIIRLVNSYKTGQANSEAA